MLGHETSLAYVMRDIYCALSVPDVKSWAHPVTGTSKRHKQCHYVVNVFRRSIVGLKYNTTNLKVCVLSFNWLLMRHLGNIFFLKILVF